MKCSMCGNVFEPSYDNKCPHCGQAVMQWEDFSNVPAMEWSTSCGSFAGSTTRPYNVELFKNGLRIRDIGLQGSAEFALRSDVFDVEGNLYSKTSSNIIKKYSTASGFIEVANCILSGDIVSNLALCQGSVYVMLDTGFLTKIDCKTMSIAYLNLAKIVSDNFAGLTLLSPKNILFGKGCMVFVSENRLFCLDIATAGLKSVVFGDVALTQTAILSEDAVYVVSKRCEIHKVLLSEFNNLTFEINTQNTASFYRRGFKIPTALVFADNALHFRLQMSDDTQGKLFYVCLDNFPNGRVYSVENDTCRARYILPSVVNGKAYVGANAYYLVADTESVIKCEFSPYSRCERSCQKIPAGCDSKIVPPIHFYHEGVGKIGHEQYPGQIAFLNERISMFHILKIKGKHKFFVITAVYKDYFSARSSDSNVYILERAPEV